MKFYSKYIALAIAVIMFLPSCGGDDPNSGIAPDKPEEPETPTPDVSAQAKSGNLPAWQKGYLDIHFINTVTGESEFIILPDGTQMLVDAASSLAATGKDELSQRWNPNKRGSEIITEYIKKCMEWTKNDRIDAFLGTHFHNDHMGGFSTSLPMSANSYYRINGATEILDNFPVTLMVDRGYPNYDYPYNQTDASKDANRANIINNYKKAIDWHMANRGLKVEKFAPGSKTQFTLQKDANSYPNVTIQNVYANGELWTGSGTATKSIFPDKSTFSGVGGNDEYSPSENACSTVFVLTYGKFNFYSGADICNSGNSTYAWKGVENEVTNVVSAVEVMKADHHGLNGTGAQILLTKLNPNIIICTPWQDRHPSPDVHKRFTSANTNNGNAKILYSNLAPSNKAQFTAGLDNIFAAGGHIVVRVDPEGKTYHVYMLNDQNDKFEIIKTIGPLVCK